MFSHILTLLLRQWGLPLVCFIQQLCKGSENWGGRQNFSFKSFENINKCYTFVKSPCRAMGA